jgi:endogenous inhibitor of DNA gyrase (YacG/DUF329 family)
VVALGQKYHAKCDYCGSTEGTDWRKGEFSLYCSKDCQRAGELMQWASASVLVVPITAFLWAFAIANWNAYGVVSGMLPILLLFSVASFLFLILVYKGIKAGSRISMKS